MLGLAPALTVVAILGKQVCGLAVVGKKLDRLSVGLGMLHAASGFHLRHMGLTLRVREERIVDDAVYSAIVVVVIATTLVTPPALKWTLGRIPAPAGPPG